MTETGSEVVLPLLQAGVPGVPWLVELTLPKIQIKHFHSKVLR
jgi:hypothetical protein